MIGNKYFAAWLGLVSCIAVCSQDARPGEGTLKPPCSRTIYLAKFSPGTIVIPESGPIEVPVGVLPFVSWDSVNTQCGQPTGAALELTLTCTPAGGGVPATIGPVSFDVPTPTTPGAQDVGSPLIFTIPQGSLSGATLQTCLVSGNISDVLDILYNAQTGNITIRSGGTVVFNGLLSVLLGDPTPAGFFIDPDIFRLITLTLLVKRKSPRTQAFWFSLFLK